MSRTAKIALVSYPRLEPEVPDRLTKTLERMRRYIDDAAASGSDLVAFPEICNTLGAPEPWQFESLEGPTVTSMSEKAQDRGSARRVDTGGVPPSVRLQNTGSLKRRIDRGV